MRRLTTCMVGLTMLAGVGGAVAPAPAHAAGCEVVRDATDRAECEARAQARSAARAEVQRQVDGAGGSTQQPGGRTEHRSPAWDKALEEAEAFDAGELVEPRPLAAVGGLVWFLLLVRGRLRSRRRAGRGASASAS